jgi:NADPH:quinone reductase-like Zn-dependent oxidoreductase
MRAVAIPTFGGPEVLEVGDIPIPEPGPGQVRIRVAFATVNPTDIGMRSGNNAALLAEKEPPYVPGMEAAGTIDAVGENTAWQVGEKVMAIVVPQRTGRGAQSEFCVVPADSVARIPATATLEAAATIPMNGLTVRRALDLLELPPGATLLVTGAAGAVGSYGVELGTADGLSVIGVASGADKAFVLGLGAAGFIERGDDLVDRVRAEFPDGVDAVLDAAVIGGPILGAIRDGGKVAAVRLFAGEPERDITVAQVRVSDYAENQAALDALGRLAESGGLTLRVAETFPPERAAEAQQKLAAGGVRGRLLIAF